MWISPVVANIEEMTFDGGAYHGELAYLRPNHEVSDHGTGYWASDITSVLFGTRPCDLLD